MNGLLLADPAWLFSDQLPGKTRGAQRNYPGMTVTEVCRMQLPPLARDCYAIIWRVASMVPEAYDVARAWNFTPKTELVWNKLTRTGKPWFGMGHHTRAAHESAILCVRGNPKPLHLNIRDTFSAVVPSRWTWVMKRQRWELRYWHSAKPDEIHELCERLYGGPYVELFSRRHRAGWLNLGRRDNCLVFPDVAGGADTWVTDCGRPVTWTPMVANAGTFVCSFCNLPLPIVDDDTNEED